MKDVFYRLFSADPPPQGGGDARSWLFYYKLPFGQEEETFVPGHQEAEAGDRLWFVLDEHLVACTVIQRVQDDNINSRYEYWYNGKELFELDIQLTEDTLRSIEHGELWDRLAKIRLLSPPPGS